MAFQEIPPNSDINTVIAMVNNIVRELNNQEVTKTWKAVDGNRGIIIGKGPDGTEIVAVAKPGYDVYNEIRA